MSTFIHAIRNIQKIVYVFLLVIFNLRTNIYQNNIRTDLFNMFIRNHIIILIAMKKIQKLIGISRYDNFVNAPITFIKFKI